MTQPEIRFNGFSDEWVEKTLDEISDKVIKGSAKADSLEIGQNAVYLDTKYLNTKSNPITTSANANVSENDVLILWDGSKAGVVYKGTKGVLGSTLKSLRINSGTSSDYVYQVLKKSESIIFDRYRTPNIPHVVKDFTRKFPIQLPTLPEQQKIGALFSKYDAIIALREQKLAELNALKKGMLQQMFDDGVATNHKPQVRFSGFSDEWVEKKLGDVFKKESVKNSNLEYGPSKIISLANLYYKNDLDNVPSDSYMKTYNKFKVGDIAFEGNKNKNYKYGRFVANTLGDGVISHVFEVYKAKVSFDTNYLGEFINYEPIMGRILRRTTKSTTMMTSLVSSDFLKEIVQLPTLPEQQKIGQLFKQLDAHISNEQSKIEQLKAQKQGLLQKMIS